MPHPASSVPATLHASLMARLDRLGPAAKDVAQTGAAIGREFGFGLLAFISQLPDPQLREALDRLTNAGLLFVRGTTPQSSYVFKHALVQDAAYGTLLRSRRQRLHSRIVATLEERFPEIVLAQPALLAHHCAAAGLAEQAVDYWLKAGQQALARSAMLEAVTQLRKGLDMLAALPDGLRRQQQELDLQSALGSALSATSGWSASEVAETLSRAYELARQLDRPERLVPADHRPILVSSRAGRAQVGAAANRAARKNRRVAERRRDAIAGPLLARRYPLFSRRIRCRPCHAGTEYGAC